MTKEKYEALGAKHIKSQRQKFYQYSKDHKNLSQTKKAYDRTYAELIQIEQEDIPFYSRKLYDKIKLRSIYIEELIQEYKLDPSHSFQENLSNLIQILSEQYVKTSKEVSTQPDLKHAKKLNALLEQAAQLNTIQNEIQDLESKVSAITALRDTKIQQCKQIVMPYAQYMDIDMQYFDPDKANSLLAQKLKSNYINLFKMKQVGFHENPNYEKEKAACNLLAGFEYTFATDYHTVSLEDLAFIKSSMLEIQHQIPDIKNYLDSKQTIDYINKMQLKREKDIYFESFKQKLTEYANSKSFGRKKSAINKCIKKLDRLQFDLNFAKNDTDSDLLISEFLASLKETKKSITSAHTYSVSKVLSSLKRDKQRSEKSKIDTTLVDLETFIQHISPKHKKEDTSTITAKKIS